MADLIEKQEPIISFGNTDERIMRYLAKIKKTGKLSLAHLKCLKPIGNDYEALVDLEKKGGAAAGFPEEINFTDAEIDMEKLKNLFIERNTMTENQFNSACISLRNNGYIGAEKFEAEQKAVTKFDEIQSAQILAAESDLNLSKQ